MRGPLLRDIDAMLHCKQRKLEPISHVGLLIHGGQPVPDGLLGQTELASHLAVRLSLDDATDEIALARRQFEVKRPVRQSTAPISFDGRMTLISVRRKRARG